jgi:glycosyltransferase involved in cell wall biosynthesis
MIEATRPLRVLRIIARLNVGGPARHTAILNAGLRARGMETLLVHGSLAPGEASLEDLARAADLPVLQIPELGRRISVWSDVRAFARILSLLREWQPDIVHTHTAKAGALGRLAAVAYNVTRRRENRCAVVHTFHGHVFEGYFNVAGSQLVRATERLLGRATDRIVAISTRQREDLTSRFAIASPEKVTVVPLGLELAELLAAPLRPISTSGRTGAPFQVGYVGRLAPIKDLGTLLAGIELARRQAGSLRLTVVGDGDERAALETRAAELGLADAVQFLGWRRDLAAVYSSMDLFALTSLNEGTPVSLIEAMAAGVPVVATAVGGVPDVVSDGTTGVLVPPRQPAALAAAIVDAVTRPSRSAHMAGLAREDVRRRFDAARLVQDIEALYLDALAHRRGDRFAGRSATGGRARR